MTYDFNQRSPRPDHRMGAGTIFGAAVAVALIIGGVMWMNRHQGGTTANSRSSPPAVSTQTMNNLSGKSPAR